MKLFFALLYKIIPLYITIALGYILSHYFGVKREKIAWLLIYILGPIVMFFATLSIEFKAEILFLPIFVFIFGSSLAFFTLWYYKKDWQDASINTLAFTNGTGNTGYFGIPLAMLLLEPQLANIFIFATLASLLYENTTGFYVTAKSNFSAKDALKKIMKLPLIYAIILGLSLNINGYSIPEFIVPHFETLKWVYGILGMMMLGMGMKGFTKDDIDFKYIKVAYFYKFIFWPLSFLLVIFLDIWFFNFLGNDIHQVLFLFSIVPLAGNTVTLAILLNAKPEKASFTVLLSTLISVVYIPVVLSAFYLFF
jgi:predicted permease